MEKKKRIFSKNIIIVSSIVAVMLISAALLILCNGSKKEREENFLSEEENVVSTDSQTQTPIEPVYLEKVVEMYPFIIEEHYKKTDYIQDVFYDTQNGNTLPYCLFVPKNYSSSKKYPVILFLHGAGESGTDNVTQLNNLNNMFEYNSDIVSDAIILCPQSPEWWNLDRDQYNDYKGTLGSALHLLNNIQKKYSCDSNRIYVMGLSMGGYATWSLLERCGNIFAAGVPICGGGNYDNGAVYKNIPIKIYHGTDDDMVAFSSSQLMYDAIVQAGGKKVDFIQLQGVGHNAWEYAFADREMFSWMFAQNKATNPNGVYEYLDRFSIKDANGKTIITDKDVIKTTNYREMHHRKKIVIELTLTGRGHSLLNEAYTSSDGNPFTFYLGTQKVYSFTATTTLEDNIFCIADVFNVDNYKNFYNAIKKRPK